MKFLVFLLLMFGVPSESELASVRNLYAQASNSEARAVDLSNKLTSVTSESDNLLLAYKGASLTLSAKFEKKINTKMQLFKEGANLIELAVKRDSTNVEVRFIRFTVQENVPTIVKYKSSLKSDKSFILTHYSEQPPLLKTYFRAFLKTSKSLTNDEKARLD